MVAEPGVGVDERLWGGQGAAPVKEGNARLLGESTVMGITEDGHALMKPEDRIRNAGKAERFVVLPKAPAGDSPPPAEAAPAQTPAAPRQLNGRARPIAIGPFVQKIELISTDDITWSDCILVIRGRDMYKLGGMAPGGKREIPLAEFVRGGREVPFVGKDRVGIFCAQGTKEIPMRL